MAENYTNLLVSYFPTAVEAEAAAKQLKAWDKEIEEIDLGAISVITMNEHGQLKEDKVGKNVEGLGAKWGLIAGAALGILGGGLTLIAGALVGLAVGGLGGAFFHRSIGMSDEDRARLKNHLQEGGAALAVMVDEVEMEGTIDELERLNASVDTYNVPQQVLDDMERMAKGDMLIHELAAKHNAA